MLEQNKSGSRIADAASSAELPGELQLALAKLIRKEIRLRNDLMKEVDEARWMILLEVFSSMAEQRDIPFMSAAHASSVPVSTAQRYIHDLIGAGLIEQHRSGADQRVLHIRLTDKGVMLVAQVIAGIHSLRAREQEL